MVMRKWESLLPKDDNYSIRELGISRLVTWERSVRMKRHALFVPDVQSTKWRLHRLSCELVATDSKSMLYYYLKKTPWL
jgi:hypothetical protein